MSPLPKCGTCRNWAKDPNQINQGHCHGAPPAMIAIPIGSGQAQIRINYRGPMPANFDGCALHQDWDAYVEARTVESRAAEPAPVNGHPRF